MWLDFHCRNSLDPVTANEISKRDGNEVGKVARGLYPNGYLVDTLDYDKALQLTSIAIQSNNGPIYEAAFKYNNLFVRADILIPYDNGFQLVEVKSSTSIKDHHLADISVQAWAIENSGINLKSCSIAFVNKDFYYQGNKDYIGLLKEENVDELIRNLKEAVPMWVKNASNTADSENEPFMMMGRQCQYPSQCEFIKHCEQKETKVEYPVEILPYSNRLSKILKEEGYSDLRDVPADRLTDQRHLRIHRVSSTGIAELDNKAIEIVKSIPYPRYYLDFETIKFAVPIWPETRPYQQIPFQWSCHVEYDNGATSHHEFLDTKGCDPRRKFAEKLIQTLGDAGPIIVYNEAFEKSRIKELAEAFPDLSSKLLLLLGRIFDLLPVMRSHYYHKDMKGKWSIKNISPTVNPELNYRNLDVSNGEMAQEAYLKLVGLLDTKDDINNIEESLLKYCKLDTFAMQELVHFIECSDSRSRG